MHFKKVYDTIKQIIYNFYYMILDNQRENPSSSQDTQEEGIKAISSETLTSPEGQETQEQARQELEALKKQIENGKVTPAFIKPFIEGLAKIPSKNKPFILWGVLSALNKMGIALESIEGGKIALAPGNHGLRPDESIATQSEVIAFEQLLNDGLKTGQFSQKDLQRALLARTLPSINAFKDISLEDKTTTDYVIYLHKKYGIAFKISEDASPEERISIEAGEGTKEYFKTIHFEDKNAYINFKNTFQEAITDNQAEKEFLLSFYDDVYYNWGENIDDNALEEIKSTQTQNQAQIFTELNTLTPTQKLALGIHSENKTEELAEKWSRDPVGAIKDSIKNGWLHLWLIFWIIWAIFWWKKWFFWWIFAWLWVAWWWIEAIISMFNKDRKKWETPSSTASNDNQNSQTEAQNENISLYQKYEWVVSWISTDNNEKQKYLEVWQTLSKNKELMNSKISEIPINWDTSAKIQFFVNHCWFDTQFLTKNQEKIKKIYEAILEERWKSIWEHTANETLRSYLERTSKKEDKASVESVVAWTIDRKKTKEQLFTEMNQWFTNFKLKINEIENSQTFYWWSSKEQKEKDSRELAEAYQNLYQYIEYFDTLTNLTPEQKNQTNSIKLYLARYYSNKWEVENDYNKNYFKSIGLALQLLPDENKPKFPWEFELAERIKWQVWIANYITKEVSENNRDINEVLQDKEIADKIVEMRWKQVDEYERKLETYLLWLDESKLDRNQKEALKLLKDIQWIGWLDVKESNFDTAKWVWWTLAAIWGWIVAAWVTAEVIPVAWWIGWTLAIVAWWAVATAWVMLSRWDNYFVDWDDGLKELAINTASFWVWWAIYKWARVIQWWNALFRSGRWIAALGTEMTWDVLLWSGIDMMRWHFEWVNIPFNEALKSNLIWWLLPLALAWGWQVKRSFSQERMRLAEDIVRQSKWAEFLQAMWNQAGAKKIWDRLLDRVNKMRTYDTETQNLLTPLKNNLDDIRALPEWWSITVWNTKITLRNWIYLFEENWITNSFNDFITSNKNKKWVPYTIKWEELKFDINLDWKITKIERSGGIIIVDRNQIIGFLNNYRNISKDILDQAIKTSYVKPFIEQWIKKLKVWDVFDMWWHKITRTQLWYKVDWWTTEFKRIDDVIHNLDPKKIIDYWKTHISLEMAWKLSDKYFPLNWKEYYFDDTTKTIKTKDASWNYVDVPPSFIDDNFEMLFKQRYWFDLSSWFKNFQNNIKNMTLWDFLKKFKPDKMWEWWSIKPWTSKFWLNTLMSEIFTLPKMVKQLSEVNYKSLSSYKDDLPKIILFWDVNRTTRWAFLRTWAIGWLVMFDWMIWDSNDSDVWDALSYMYGWIITQAALQFVFDKN